MKKLTFSLLLILSCVNYVHSQSGWFWQNPLPQGNNLNSIKFINENIGYAVGNLGSIVKTTNGGQSWNLTYSNSKKFNSISLIDSVNIIICGDSGSVMKSLDNGINWIPVSIVTNSNLNKIIFINNFTGYIVGNSGNLFKSTNQGVSWFNIQSGTINDLYTIYFKNLSTGYVSGSSIYRITTNSGNSWNTYSLPTGVNFRDIVFLNDNTGFGVGNYQHFPGPNGVVYKTSNGGFNWNTSGSFGTPDCFSIGFRDTNTGYISSANGIIVTTNSGINWSFGYYDYINYYTSFTIVNNNCFATGWGGNILKSSNNGINWVNQTNSFNGYSNSNVFFVNSNVGYICGNEPGDSMIIKTTNGGQKWIQLQGPNSSFNFSMFFTAVDTGYVTNGTNIIHKTTNGGINWQSFQTGSGSGFRKIYFTDPHNGVAGGYNGVLYKTSNGGNNWFLSGTFQGTIYDISFPDSYNGYAVEAGYGIIKTTNGGNSWFNLSNIPNVYYIPSVFFINSTTGFVIASPSSGGTSIILKTTDSGLSWQNKFTSLLDRINDIKLLQTGVGYAIGAKGKILKTLNFGENWYYQNSITDNTLWSISVINDSLSYLVGDSKTILKTTNGGGRLIGIQPINNQIPQNISLHQNYPNPFNPVTKIKFDIPKSSSAKIIIYDLLGREVTILVNEQLKSGSYETEWDGSNFASGIYFYSLITDEFTETKRMVLIK